MSLNSGIEFLRRSSSEVISRKSSAGISYHKAVHGQKHTRCFFRITVIAVILCAQYEHLPPHKPPSARCPAADLFRRPGSALLASQRARESVLDVQCRQSDIGVGAVF